MRTINLIKSFFNALASMVKKLKLFKAKSLTSALFSKQVELWRKEHKQWEKEHKDAQQALKQAEQALKNHIATEKTMISRHEAELKKYGATIDSLTRAGTTAGSKYQQLVKKFVQWRKDHEQQRAAHKKLIQAIMDLKADL